MDDERPVAKANYFEIDAILSEEERVQTEFQIDAYGLGYLDPARNAVTDPDLTSGSSLSLPYWMVQPLNKRNWVELRFPKYYGKLFLDELLADAKPEVLSLHDKSPYFEVFGFQ